MQEGRLLFCFRDEACTVTSSFSVTVLEARLTPADLLLIPCFLHCDRFGVHAGREPFQGTQWDVPQGDLGIQAISTLWLLSDPQKTFYLVTEKNRTVEELFFFVSLCIYFFFSEQVRERERTPLTRSRYSYPPPPPSARPGSLAYRCLHA